MAEFSPMMAHYLEIKKQNSDCVIFYRLGDFYEMFFEDAITGSKELDLTLTGRDCGKEERAPMCGVPYHSAEAYIARLVAKGYKVAICEQVEDPKEAKGIVKREITKIVTPGSVTESNMLDETKNNYLAAVYKKGKTAAVCFADISTGIIKVTSPDGGSIEKIENELARFSPAEVLIHAEKDDEELIRFLKDKIGCFYAKEDELFDEAECRKTLVSQFGEEKLRKMEIDSAPGAALAVGALLAYLGNTQKGRLPNLSDIEIYSENQFMEIDVNTRRNLELCENMRQKSKANTLLSVLEKTKTSMGSRALRRFIEQPLCNVGEIKRRQDVVSAFFSGYDLLFETRKILDGINDLERLTCKVVYNTANARDLKAIGAAAGKLPAFRAVLSSGKNKVIDEMLGEYDDLEDINKLICDSICENPPVSISEGEIILKGFDHEVDRLREMRDGGAKFIADMEQREKEKTGIKNLKIGYNKVFGYYIEITKSNYDQIPEEYIRKQTLANCERFINEELKEYEQTVLSASEKLCAREYEIFCKIRDDIARSFNRIQTAADKLAVIDVLSTFAVVAKNNNYVCPEVDFSSEIVIKNGRHPVVELGLEGGLFVPNDTMLDTGAGRLAIITGPNMAGKSTYMRQTAIITVMAQIGSFVPASEARIGVVDKLFTRVGASDDLAAGQSTFMVEMSEVAYILKNATKRSLLIFDEIGRGTSTYDGMSIAKAVVEYVTDKKKLGAKSMFATHYHELTTLESEIDGVKNYNIAVKKRGDEITFLRKIVRGGADDSYGIEVALLAGVPGPVIARAKEILSDLESGERMPVNAPRSDDGEITLDSFFEKEIVEKLRKINVNTLTPLECMQKLNELVTEAEKI